MKLCDLSVTYITLHGQGPQDSVTAEATAASQQLGRCGLPRVMYPDSRYTELCDLSVTYTIRHGQGPRDPGTRGGNSRDLATRPRRPVKLGPPAGSRLPKVKCNAKCRENFEVSGNQEGD